MPYNIYHKTLCVCLYIYIYIYMHIFIDLFIQIFIHIYLYISICICICICICIYIYIHWIIILKLNMENKDPCKVSFLDLWIDAQGGKFIINLFNNKRWLSLLFQSNALFGQYNTVWKRLYFSQFGNFTYWQDNTTSESFDYRNHFPIEWNHFTIEKDL